MQPVILRQGLRLRCVLLLFFSVLRVWANYQEGSVLQKWKSSLSDPNNNLESWKDSTDPCGTNPWNHIICVEGVFVKRIDISGSGLSGQLFPGLGQLSRLEALTVYNNRFNGSIPAALGNLSSLSFLDMHNNTLSGSIPDALGKLSKLTTLNLGYNSLSGTIPASLTNLNSLLVIDLRNNSLTGKVPNNGSFSKLDAQSSFEGNTGLCGSLVNLQCPGDPPLSSATPGSTGSVGAIGGGVAGVIAVLLFGIGLFIWWRRRRRQRQRHPDDKDDFVDEPEQEDNLEIHLGQLKRYTFAQLRQATDNFSIKNEVGHGGFGKVYKGVLPDGTLLAVKRLKRERTQGNEEQFQMEVHIISMATHRNLLGLYGFCMTPTERMLVYPFMSNGSVSSQLQKADDGGPPLSCKARKKIALGAAKGLAYLHEQCDPKIIHRDVKADNILLDDEMEAVVGDFGLAKAVDFKNTHVTTAIRGTLGHIAPEYMSTGKSSEKTDVYGYGITLLQLITGQGAVNLSRLADNDEVMLLDWVKKLEKEDRVEVMVDPNLKEYDVADIKELLRVALLCTINSSSARPKMSEVVSMLEGDGLEERWEEWEQKEVKSREALYRPHFPAEWALDSNSSFMQKFVLSGPR